MPFKKKGLRRSAFIDLEAKRSADDDVDDYKRTQVTRQPPRANHA